MKFEYDTIKYLDNQALMEIFAWCDEQFGYNNWECNWQPNHRNRTFTFKTEENRTWFLLKWS